MQVVPHNMVILLYILWTTIWTSLSAGCAPQFGLVVALYIHAFPACRDEDTVESPEHILLHCPAYTPTRHKLITLCLQRKDPVSHLLVTRLLLSNSPKKIMQFLLDCSAIPEVIHSAQLYGDHIYSDIFYLSRTWCFSVHRERMKRLCRWNFR